MANSPVQIILNSSQYIDEWDRQARESKKDFFEGRDEDFVAHRDLLIQQLGNIKSMQLRRSTIPVCYGKVILNKEALVKSHRPVKQVFKNKVAPIVGAGKVGEYFVELTSDSIDKLNATIGRAEGETIYKKDKEGEGTPATTRLRSEVGAIQEILPYDASDKRRFSVKDAVDWLSNAKSGGYYLVELFVPIPPVRSWAKMDRKKQLLFDTFLNGLRDLGGGIIATPVMSAKHLQIFGIRLHRGDAPSIVQADSLGKETAVDAGSFDASVKRHAALVNFLDNHPLVKMITLPPVITQSQAKSTTTKGDKFVLPKPDENKQYPKLGIVDGGVSDVYKPWIEASWDNIAPAHKDLFHGSTIAGLAVAGQYLNGVEICQEIDGCKIIDVGLLPRDDIYDSYYNHALEVFAELEYAVEALKKKTGVRVFNFSLNVEEHASTDGYSYAARRLDEIAEQHDVVFVISAGNITNEDHIREEWPTDHVKVLEILVGSNSDRIKMPAESCRNVSVSALNPPGMDGIVAYALTSYSCRGPGLKVGLKPDFGHVGGCGTRCDTKGYGLFSLDASGNKVDVCGTSYAAPIVGKSLASLDSAIEGGVPRETLIGLSVHHAGLPASLTNKKLQGVAKYLVGFGIPAASEQLLEGDPSTITLVFSDWVRQGYKMRFPFSWPTSLVKNGKCFGKARLTIVSTPDFDYRYGSEFVRVNVDAMLRQMNKEGKFNGKLKPLYTPDESDDTFDKDEIEHAYSWSPVKVYEKTFTKGVGPSTQWCLDVEYLAREGAQIPANGIPFTAILSISDPENGGKVFNEMRQMLQSTGVKAVDIKTAARVKPRP